MPESAIRPANTERMAGVLESKAFKIFLNCLIVKIAVTLQTTPRFDKRATKSTVLSPLVFVIEIKKLASNDNRSYHINSDKIFRTLGFKAKRSLEEAVKDLCLSFEKGLIVNSFENDLYYNVRRLKNIKAK